MTLQEIIARNFILNQRINDAPVIWGHFDNVVDIKLSALKRAIAYWIDNGHLEEGLGLELSNTARLERQMSLGAFIPTRRYDVYGNEIPPIMFYHDGVEGIGGRWPKKVLADEIRRQPIWPAYPPPLKYIPTKGFEDWMSYDHPRFAKPEDFERLDKEYNEKTETVMEQWGRMMRKMHEENVAALNMASERSMYKPFEPKTKSFNMKKINWFNFFWMAGYYAVLTIAAIAAIVIVLGFLLMLYTLIKSFL